MHALYKSMFLRDRILILNKNNDENIYVFIFNIVVCENILILYYYIN